MNLMTKLWKNFFLRRRLSKARFIINLECLRKPEIHTKVDGLFNACDGYQKLVLAKICIAMQKNIDWHVGALMSFNTTPLQLKRDKMYVIKSCFEAMMVQWAFLHQAFGNRDKKQTEAIKECLYWITYYSFDKYTDVFSNANYNNYDDAYQYLVGAYWVLPHKISKKNSSFDELGVLFENVINNPLSVEQEDTSEFAWKVNNFSEERLEAMSFTTTIVGNLKVFEKEIELAFYY